jgi:LysM repeat protein
MMTSVGQDLLSQKASVIWMAALCAVLVFHCGHLIRMRGEHRWYHSAHVVMLLGMLCMYASVAFGFEWFPTGVWIIIYVVTSAAIIGWMLARFRQRRPYGKLWILALVQQGAMIYMWAPMRYWAPPLSYAFAFYFLVETVAWLRRACVRPTPSMALAGVPGSAVVPLAPRSAFGDICMTLMAAAMGYMFVGMQLMMSAPRQSDRLAQQQISEPSLAPSNSERYEAKQQALAQSSTIAGNESPGSLPAASANKIPERYTIVAGDTLRGVAVRFYGTARYWRSIAKINSGLNPRRLHIGDVIKLPKPLAPQ